MNYIILSISLGQVIFMFFCMFVQHKYKINPFKAIQHLLRFRFKSYLAKARCMEGDTVYIKAYNTIIVCTVESNWKYIEKMMLLEKDNDDPIQKLWGTRILDYDYIYTIRDLTPAEQVLFGENDEIR